MTVSSFYPVLMSQNVSAAASFYRDLLGFETTFETDWYVSLRLGQFELAILDHGHATVPERHRALPQGVLLNLEVDDVDALHDRVVERSGLDPLLPLRDEAFGQRHAIFAAPDGILLDLIQPIEPSAEFSQAYVETTS